MTPRVPKKELTGVSGAVVKAVSRRMFGQVAEPAEVGWHHRKVLMASLGFGRKVESWNAVDAGLKTFAHMAVAAKVGCSWCLDLNYFKAQNEHLDLAKASQVPRWREADVFTPGERDVLEYAEAVTDTPPTVTDALVARLLEALGPAGVMELTAVIGFANLTTRSNVAVGIESQGFSASCAVPLAGSRRSRVRESPV
jgi:alkylhydroperoxidase family enzyme